jgi:Concanavalin A-like lectin/glucanases superfamily
MRRSLAIAAALAVLMLTIVPVTGALATQDGVLVGAAAPSWQTNASVQALGAANGVIYVGGEFTSVRPPGAAAGTNEVSRTYLAAFNSTTGDLLTSFNHTLNGSVWSMTASPDQTKMFVGGDFTTVDGISHNHMAAFNTTTGALLPWPGRTGFRVMAMAARANTLYVGGSFDTVNGQPRTRLGAVTVDTGSLLPWAPTADADVLALAIAKDGSKVFVGGRFNNLNSQAHHAIGSLDPTTGTLIPFPAETAVPPVTPSCTSTTHDLRVDDTTVYAANAGAGGGCFDGTFAARVADGTLKWRNDCLGATEAIELIGNWLYKGSHAHDCSRAAAFPQLAGTFMANYNGNGANLLNENLNDGSLGPWNPDTNVGPPTSVGPLAMATDGQQLLVGGDFTMVNKVGQQGFVRFPTGPDTTVPGRPSNFTVASVAPGTVKINFTTGLDRDDENITYRLFRDGASTPIQTWTVRSRFWQIPAVTYEDTGLTPGTSHFYQVEATDGVNKIRTANSAAVTVASATAPYRSQVSADFPSFYWRLGENSGSTAADATGHGRTGTYQSGVTKGVAGALSNDADTAVRLSGTSTGRVTSNTNTSAVSATSAPQSFSVEAWFRTATTAGGKLIGLGNSQTGTSSRFDRNIYMTNNGRLIFGVNTGGLGGTRRTITSSASYNDNSWHHVVGTLSPAGLVLYVDGSSVASDPTTTTADYYDGYWRVGGDSLSGWPNAPTSSNFNGTVDEAAVYLFALPATSVAEHFNAR